MRGTKSFIHKSNKNRGRNSDAEKLDELQTHLTALGWHIKREPMLENSNYSTKNHIRNPDLKITLNKFEYYLELDGRIHGDLQMPNKKTLQRNTDYEVNHDSYIIINEEDAKFFKLDKCDLAAYMVLHEYSKHLAKLNGGLMFV